GGGARCPTRFAAAQRVHWANGQERHAVMSNFGFLEDEWPEIYEVAVKAESALTIDPRSTCFFARRAVELIVRWVYTADEDLKLPYQDHLDALLHEPTFKEATGEAA